MEKRRTDSLNLETSLLGFGCMRLPENNGAIDRKKTTEMLEMALSNGVNYFDTAYVYHDGKSEGAMGAVLKKHPRGSYFIADKMPVWQVKAQDDLERIFNEQLERLGTEYIDFYLLHSLNRAGWENVKKFDMIRFLEKKRAQGKLRFIGYSFHDTPEVFREIINAYHWDFCQIQLNYVDWEAQGARELYQLTEEKNIPLIVMEPVHGGDLANPADEIKRIFTDAAPSASVASWALRYVGSLPQVKVILSGMSTTQQVEDNLTTFADFRPLTPEEYKVIDSVNEAMGEIPQIGCTGCRYCMPCPAGVNIPQNFKTFNNFQKYQNPGSFRWNFAEMKKGISSSCVSCGACVSKCPQHIAIPKELKRVTALADSLK
jgi:predicted aldo/keto reductase-like oxidoreductase